jgi:biotin transport system substrate-specific component
MQNATIPSILIDRIRGRAALNMLLIAGASVVIAIAAQISVPLPHSPVPLTMQPLAVLLVGVVLGSWRGAAAAALYLMEGLGGLPVGAQGHGGPAWLIGPTAGYLLSYPLAAFVAGWVSERGWGSTVTRAVAGMLAALAIIYVGGWSWLTIVAGGAQRAFVLGVAPFLIADAIKVALGAVFLPKAQRAIARLTA